MFDYSDLISLLLAIAFAAAIGLEREISGKAAGIRTNVLICLGATVFTIVSNSIGADNDRIASQIVTGVGFLGAGAIIQDRGGVHGLTTAATIWLVAGVGMVCGARMYKLALFATILTILVLYGFAAIEKSIERYAKRKRPHKKPPEGKDHPPLA